MVKISNRVKAKPVKKEISTKKSSASETKAASPKNSKKILSGKNREVLQKATDKDVAKKIKKLETRVETLKDQVKALKDELSEANQENAKLRRRMENQKQNQREKLQMLKDGRDDLFPSIQSLSKDDDGVVSFAVHAAGNFDADSWLISRYTNNLDAARELADTLVRKGHKCVRLYERGKWSNKSGNRKTGFVAFWWSDKDYVGESPTGRGYGIPDGQKQRVEYTPEVQRTE